MMYLTTNKVNRIEKSTFSQFQEAAGWMLPKAYCNFLEAYGTGTYDGVLHIFPADTEIAKEEAYGEFWIHENAPITKEQLKECSVIGCSIDG